MKYDTPYLRDTFWISPEAWFWETGMYSEKTKEHFRKWVRGIYDEVARKKPFKTTELK